MLSNHKPAYRKLRGYAFDPSLSLKIDTATVNIIVYKVEWEELEKYTITEGNNNTTEDGRTIPSGEYLEIVDYDPATGVFYPPVDLDNRFVLAQDGLTPNVSNPQFHQQMVYAVVMTTIKNFEQALGRKIQWSEHLKVDQEGKLKSEFVRRLRVYPHALRQPNAYYDPQKKALLFGYFPAQPANPDLHIPGGTVFTCLSHDVIAHETTHAILDGLHRRFIEPTHPDTRAFHEAFADLVALLQHFTFPDVLKHQIAKTRGDLTSQNLLGQLAQEFGTAVGGYSSLRDAIGHTDRYTGKWVPHEPDPREYATKMEFHDRGAILVAAIFDAFLSIYKQRVKKYLRVATGGSGILPAGDLHPDMVDLMAEMAADTASRILKMCVRALDYCPPVDLNFGDYLRAIITADIDMVADDEKNYRVAFTEAFQKRGIYPIGVKSMAIDALCYEKNPSLNLAPHANQILVDFFREFKAKVSYEASREKINEITDKFIGGGQLRFNEISGVHDRINSKFLMDGNVRERFSQLTGLMFFPNDQAPCEQHGFEYSTNSDTAKYEIGNLWLASRVTPDGGIVNNVILTILQKRGVLCKIDEDGNFVKKGFRVPKQVKSEEGFVFRGGATLVFDLDDMCLRYVIKKDINDEARMEAQFRYRQKLLGGDGQTYFDGETLSGLAGPFAMMHSINHIH